VAEAIQNPQICGTTAPTNRVIVRFAASSEWRIASTLLMAWSTVVWCLSPNSRPISWSDAPKTQFGLTGSYAAQQGIEARARTCHTGPQVERQIPDGSRAFV
jgi:hypothetical protein